MTKIFSKRFILIMIGLLVPVHVHAQSGTIVGGNSVVRASSTAPPEAETAAFYKGTEKLTFPIAMEGYCPVTILETHKWAKGSTAYTVLLDGKIYLFTDDNARQRFLENVTQYAPALGGDCVVSAAERGRRVAGTVFHTVIHEGRTFLFEGAAPKAKFVANPQKYENVDLALNGQCPVCRVESSQEVGGKPEFGTLYGGMRYFFPTLEHKKLFLANPAKYATANSIPK